MHFIWACNAAAEAMKWWKQKDEAVMVDRLMNLVMCCNQEAKLGQRITEIQAQLIKLPLFFIFWL